MIRLLGAALLVALVAVACGRSDGAVGRELYDARCASCHGADGVGGSGPPVTRDAVAVRSDQELADVTTMGEGTMPAFPSLSEEQVASLIELMRRW